LNELKSSFVSMVSHEFRTPLEVILSSSHILDRYLDRLTPEKRHEQLRAIRKSVHRMSDLMEDVLTLGKIEGSRLSCAPAPIDLAAFCRRCVDEIDCATQSVCPLRLQIGELAGEATADEGLLGHIVLNLLSNAVKYSPPGRPVHFEVSREGLDARLIVRDEGRGIPAEDLPRLFTAFYRARNVSQIPGNGLGLVIVKRCVDLHGGTIQCASEEGRGTTFTVTLPLFDGTRILRRLQPAATSIAVPDEGTKT
jgi:signal transduction histidine kinase